MTQRLLIAGGYGIVGSVHGFDNLGKVDLIVSSLQDPSDSLIEFALQKGIAHIGITKLADELAPLTFAALATHPKRPIVPLGHSQSGIMTIVALKIA